jgi:hypothetical protein
MDKRHIISGFFWLAISIFVILKSFELGIGTFSSPGSGFVFFWASLILGVLSICLIVRSLLEKKGMKLIDLWKGVKWIKVVLTIIIIFLYAITLTELGFILSTFLLMVVLFIMGNVKYWVALSYGFLTMILSYILFHFLLQIQFPRGILNW